MEIKTTTLIMHCLIKSKHIKWNCNYYSDSHLAQLELILHFHFCNWDEQFSLANTLANFMGFLKKSGQNSSPITLPWTSYVVYKVNTLLVGYLEVHYLLNFCKHSSYFLMKLSCVFLLLNLMVSTQDVLTSTVEK